MDEQNLVTVPGKADKKNFVTAWLQWNGSPLSNDYNLYIMDSNGSILDVSAAPFGFEAASWTNDSENPADVFIAVQHVFGDTPELSNKRTARRRPAQE